MGIFSGLADHRELLQWVQQQVGHTVEIDSRDGASIGAESTGKMWRVTPAKDVDSHEFMFWYKSCNRQWFATPQEAVSAYCDKWKEWHHSVDKQVDYSADSIEYRP